MRVYRYDLTKCKPEEVEEITQSLARTELEFGIEDTRLVVRSPNNSYRRDMGKVARSLLISLNNLKITKTYERQSNRETHV